MKETSKRLLTDIASAVIYVRQDYRDALSAISPANRRDVLQEQSEIQHTEQMIIDKEIGGFIDEDEERTENRDVNDRAAPGMGLGLGR